MRLVAWTPQNIGKEEREAFEELERRSVTSLPPSAEDRPA